jgi:hypothetical protein
MLAFPTRIRRGLVIDEAHRHVGKRFCYGDDLLSTDRERDLAFED